MDFWNLSDAAIKAKNKKELLDFAFKVSSKIFEDDLEEKIIEVWNSLGFNEELKTSDIQACHRLDELSGASPTSPKKTIARFVNRKHAEMLYSKRFEIKDADLSSTGIPENVNRDINPNFCPSLMKKLTDV